MSGDYKNKIDNLEKDLFEDIMKKSESEIDDELKELGVDPEKQLKVHRYTILSANKAIRHTK